MMNEPSVLDYVKAKLLPWKYSLPENEIKEAFSNKELPGHEIPVQKAVDISLEAEKSGKAPRNLLSVFPVRTLAAFLFAIVAQSNLEPPDRAIPFAVLFYFFAAGFVVWAILSNEWKIEPITSKPKREMDVTIDRSGQISLGISFGFMLLAFLLFRGNRFTVLNIFIWLIAIFSFLYAVLDRSELSAGWDKVRGAWFSNSLNIRITPFLLLLVSAFGLVFFFRFYQLDTVLAEMFSDHAEKLYDVMDVLNGEYAIFFPRNTGREAFQFYLTAFVATVFGTGISFMSLKIGTALAGFLTLPFIYLLGKELGNRWVGLLALLFAGIAYWHNVISRVGLRFPLYPLFVAPTLYFLIRGIRRGNRNDFVFAGIALGIGLHGYSTIRFLPVVVLAAVLLYIIQEKSKLKRENVIFALILLVIASFLFALPLFTYAVENPEMFGYRMMSRLGTTERAYSQSPFIIFFKNLWDALTMFFYSNGNTWVHSIPLRPALDITSAALFFIGSIMMVLRYIRHRNWEDLFILLSVPLLMMTSILSLAFPEENPSLNRTGGAIIPVFIIIGFGLHGLLHVLWEKSKRIPGKATTVLFGLTVFFWSASANYDLVFNQFHQQFVAGAWNTSQIGKVITGFAQSTGSADNAYVVPYPHWVDTRLVGINAGYPGKDYALWPDHFSETLNNDGEKLFIVKPENQEAIDLLRQLYPDGAMYRYDSGTPGKDFIIINIPPQMAPADEISNP